MPKKHFSFQKEHTAPVAHDAGADIAQFIAGQTTQITRKTIALPEESFIRVKIEAAKRRIPAYQLWGEIVEAYFRAHAE
jgi:hypothetical protein